MLDANWRQARVAAGGGRAAWEKAWGLVARLPGCAARCSTWGDVLFPRTPADERIAQTGRVLLGGGGLAAAAARRAGDGPDPIDGLSCAFCRCRGRLWFMGCRHSLAAAHLHLADRVARVRDSGLSGSGARLKIVISQPWRVGNRSRLVAGWPAGAAAALSAPSPYLQPLLVAGWYLRRTKRNRLL